MPRKVERESKETEYERGQPASRAAAAFERGKRMTNRNQLEMLERMEKNEKREKHK